MLPLLALSPLSIVKLGAVLLGLFNLALTLKGYPSPSSWSVTEPRRSTYHHLSLRTDQTVSETRRSWTDLASIHHTVRVRIKEDHPDFELLHLDTPPPRTPGPGIRLFTEETVHYPVSGPRAELEWGSLVPEGNHGLVLLDVDVNVGLPDADRDAPPRAYAVSMFHTLHCLDRIRRAIVVEPPVEPAAHGESTSTNTTTANTAAAARSRARYHVHHCFNYVRQMVLCGADTRLNPTDHVQPSGRPAADGIGLMYECRDWKGVYEAFEANYALNRTLSFAQ